MKDLPKSQGEVWYLDLCVAVVRSDPLGLNPSKHLDKDIETMKSRFFAEGLSFLTKTLPKLGKALDQGLVSSRFYCPREFKRSHENRSIPAFGQAYFNLVFDESGVLRTEVDPAVIGHLRQVLFFAYKLQLPYTSEQEERTVASFIQNDVELEDEVTSELDEVIHLAKKITAGIFEGFDPKDIWPRHGPGAVATGERLEGKWSFARLYSRIHNVYPYYDYYIVGGARELIDRLDWYRSLERHESGTAKVVLVPKDSRGPRLISAEPLEYQWIQQGLGRKLVQHFEKTSSLTKGQINFTLQEINQSLAITSSTSGNYATLDLKDASDRVSLALVRRVFEDTPRLLRALEACRTTATRLPNGDVLTLRKFAPMGSALCFPVEAYIFWVLQVAAMQLQTGLPLRRVVKRIFVYGDDIIVPTHWAARCIQVLELAGLKVNKDKSCLHGNFRESCGIDAFKGVVVTPIRLSSPWTAKPTDGAAYASYVSIANRIGEKGYKEASDLLWKEIEKVYGKVPYGTSRSSYPCKVVQSPDLAISFNRKYFRSRWNRNLQRSEFMLKRVVPTRRKLDLDDWPRMLRAVSSEPYEDPRWPYTIEAYEPRSVGDPSEVVVPRSTRIKRGWTAVY